MIRLCAFADEAASDLDGQIEALKRNGINLLELRSINGKNVSAFTEEETEKYAETLEKNGISVWSIGSPLGKSDIREDMDEYLKRAEGLCKIANGFKAKNLRAFSFFNAYNNEDEVIKRLEKTVEIGDKYGVRICHENEKDIYGDILSRTLNVVNSVKGIYSVYDPANFIQCGEKADDTIAALFDKTYYFHIKDVVEQTGELVPAGYGNGKIDKIIESIKDDKVLTLEPHLALFDAYKSIDGTEMKHKFHFKTAGEAFDTAVNSLKNLLFKQGYKEENNVFVK